MPGPMNDKIRAEIQAEANRYQARIEIMYEEAIGYFVERYDMPEDEVVAIWEQEF